MNVFENGQSNPLLKAVTLGFEQTGSKSFVLHWNPDHGGIMDSLESMWGTLTGTSAQGRELGRFLAATSDIKTNLFAHSQGGISTNIGVNQVINQYGRESLPNLSVHYNGSAVNSFASQMLLSNAGARFDGFTMHHGDPIPLFFNTLNPLQMIYGLYRMVPTIRGDEHGSTHTHYFKDEGP
jgi:hypothetical protein